ncbi:MAG: class I SAM-dependent methyltransferase [Nitrospinales bacterium]
MSGGQTDPTKFQFTKVGTTVTKTYEELLVPRIMIPCAEILLDQARVEKGQHVLDVACGPGTVTYLVAEKTGPEGNVTGVDISPEMLDIARSKISDPNSAPTEFIESSCAPLNVPDSAYDVVVCQHGLQFFPDRVESLKEMARAAQPNSIVAVAAWGAIEKNPVMNAIHQALQDSTSPEVADMMKAPFSMNDLPEIYQIFKDAGLKNIDIQGHTIPVTFEGGVSQVGKCLEATPIASNLSEYQKITFKQELDARLEYLLDGDSVKSTTFTHIILALA